MPTWEASQWRRSLVVLVGLKVAGLVLVFDVGGKAADPFDLAKSTFSRGVEWILGALLVVALFRWGFAIFPRTWLHLAVALVVATSAASASVALDQYVALFGGDGRYLGLTFIVDMALLYLAVAASFRTVTDWVVLLGAGTIALLISGIYALVQFLGMDPLSWTASPRSNPFSTVGNQNTYGHFLSVAVATMAGLALLYRGAHRRLVGPAAAVVFIFTLVLAGVVGARGTAVAAAAAYVGAAHLYSRARVGGSAGARRAIALFGVAAAVIALLVAVTPVGARLAGTLQGTGTEERTLVWDAALRASADRPILGYGVDNFGPAWPRYRPLYLAHLAPGISNDSAHDWILQATATTGALGLVALLAMLALSLGPLAASGFRRSPLVASLLLLASVGYWAHALVSVGTIAVDWVPWVVSGGTAAIVGSRAVPGTQRRLHPVIQATIIAAAAVAAASGARALDANRDALATRQAADSRRAADAIEHGERAVSLDSGRASYWNELGRAYFVGARWRDATDAFTAAHARAPWSATYLSNLARSLTQLAKTGDDSHGSTAAALDAAQQAIDADPNDPEPHATLAEIADVLGRHDIALGASVDAWRLYPSVRYDRLAVTSATAITDLSVARAALESALAASESVPMRVTLAKIALRQGDRSAALASAKKALEFQPGNTDALALVKELGG